MRPATFLCVLFIVCSACASRTGTRRPGTLASSPAGNLSVKVYTLPCPRSKVSHVKFAPGRNKLLSTAADESGISTLKIWNASSGEAMESFVNDTFIDQDAAFSHDGLTIAIGNQTVFLLWADNYKVRRSFQVDAYSDLRVIDVDQSLIYPWAIKNVEVLKKIHYVTCLAFSADDRLLVSGYENGQIKVWNTRYGNLLQTLRGGRFHGGILDVEFSPDGGHIAACQEDDKIRVWSYPRYEEKILRGHDQPVKVISFDPVNGYLASGGRDRKVKIWDVGRGEVLRTLSGHTGAVLALSFSRDGRYLASAGGDKTVRIWDVAAAQELVVLRDHHRAVNDLSFNANASLLASAGDDEAIRIWDISDLNLISDPRLVPQPLYPPRLVGAANFVDLSGDGVLEKGEEGKLIIEARNTGGDAAYQIVTMIVPDTLRPDLKIAQAPLIPQLLPGESVSLEVHVARAAEEKGQAVPAASGEEGFTIRMFECNGFHLFPVVRLKIILAAPR
ncbi:MAG: WD40 repeat domain-containing protein [Candidatus Krumholzibacteriota bacterium]|nr:WD40 repeat domain-containing protein [Candidatus Krumholzibacteriota bacterium]